MTFICNNCDKIWDTNLELDEARCMHCNSLNIKEFIEKPRDEYE